VHGLTLPGGPVGPFSGSAQCCAAAHACGRLSGGLERHDTPHAGPDGNPSRGRSHVVCHNDGKHEGEIRRYVSAAGGRCFGRAGGRCLPPPSRLTIGIARAIVNSDVAVQQRHTSHQPGTAFLGTDPDIWWTDVASVCQAVMGHTLPAWRSSRANRSPSGSTRCGSRRIGHGRSCQSNRAAGSSA
jgi:hypothetical protein